MKFQQLVHGTPESAVKSTEVLGIGLRGVMEGLAREHMHWGTGTTLSLIREGGTHIKWLNKFEIYHASNKRGSSETLARVGYYNLDHPPCKIVDLLGLLVRERFDIESGRLRNETLWVVDYANSPSTPRGYVTSVESLPSSPNQSNMLLLNWREM